MDKVTQYLRKLKETNPRAFAEAIMQMTEEEVLDIIYDWEIWARDNQLPPTNKQWRIWLVLAGRGFGKVVYPYEDILTANKGWVKFGDLQIGDIVYDENGKETNVTQIHYPPPSKGYRLTFSDTSTIDVCKDHLWVTWTHRDRKQFLRYKENGTFPPENWPSFKGDIHHARSKKPVGHYGPKIRTTQEVVDTLQQNTKRKDLNHSIPVCKPLEMKETSLPVDPYVYGYWVGDGTRRSSHLTIHKDDQESFIEQCNKVGYKVNVHKCPKSVLVEGLITQLKQEGMDDKKNIPDKYLYNSIENRLSFLQGLMDSDGYTSGKHVEFCSMTKEHAEIVYYLAASLGQKPVLKTGNALLNGKNYGIKYRVFFTPTINVFRLPRKANKFSFDIKKNQSSRQKHRMIVSAEEIPPVDNWSCITVDSPNNMFLVGRNFIPTHNTRTANEWIIQRAREGKGPIALIGKTTGDVRDTIIEVGESSIMQISPSDFKPIYEPSKRRLTWPNGVTATTFSGDEWDQLRGPQHRSVLIDELPKFASPEDLYTQMDMGLRIGEDAACIISTTPLPIPIIKELYLKAQDPNSDVVLTTGSTLDNAANLGKKSVQAMIDRYKGTRLEKQELFGEIIWESETSYFKSEDIDKYRVDSYPPLRRIIIAVDPAVTAGENSDSTGIIVAGIDAEGHMYVLADRTMKGTPQQWASMVGELYQSYQADSVVAEKNQGGDMVLSTIQSFGGNIPVKLVTATRGKLVRAEGPSLLFEQGKIHLVGNFPNLEQQMVTYDGSQKKSPDNYDAFIWACTELMLGKQNTASSRVFLL